MREHSWNADCWRIGVTGLTAGAGVSFLTVCMAGYFAEEKESAVAVAEMGNGGIYDGLGMDRRFALREYQSFCKAAAGSANIRRIANREEGVNWALKLPSERETILDYRESLRLIYGLCGDVTLFDFSGRRDEEGWLLLKEMDTVVGVVDPLPDRLLAGRGTLERWKLSGLPVSWLINKYNDGIDRKELDRFLKLKDQHTAPFLKPELIYGAQYAGVSPWSIEGVRAAFSPVFSRLFDGIG